MDDPIIADVDRDVIDVLTIVREEEQVTRTQRAWPRRHCVAEIRHPARAVRQPHALAPEHPLHESRSVEAVVWTGAIVSEPRSDILIRRREDARCKPAAHAWL